jgi:hypothetical protein
MDGTTPVADAMAVPKLAIIASHTKICAIQKFCRAHLSSFKRRLEIMSASSSAFF